MLPLNMFLALAAGAIAAAEAQYTQCSVTHYVPCGTQHDFDFLQGNQFSSPLDCVFTFSTEPICTLTTQVQNTDLAAKDAAGNCSVDALTLFSYDRGQLTQNETYCGQAASNPEVSTGSNLVVMTFHSEENATTATKRQFSVNITASVLTTTTPAATQTTIKPAGEPPAPKTTTTVAPQRG